MRSRLLSLLLIAGAALALAACSSGEAEAGRVGVGMLDNFYSREVTRVPVGGTVRFENDGQVPHNAVASGGEWSTEDTFGSLVMEPGDAASITVDEPGVYTYYCTFHGTPDGEGMAAVLVVGDVEYTAAEDTDAPAEPVTEWTGVTRRVPEDHPTIQNAVDAAEPGDLVLVGPAPQDAAHEAPDGRYVYKEQVDVTTPYLTIRGTDRNEVIIDGEFTRPNAINVAAADGVAVENLTTRNATLNGVFFTGLRGYRASYVTAYNNGVYGIYSFDATDGLFEHSYASGSPDAGFYIGQCQPCEAVITDSVAENNALGYSGTNASGELYLVNSVWRNNIVGIAPNTLDSELLPPQHDITIVGNLVHDNNNRDVATLDLEWPTFGNGIIVAGGLDAEIARNRIVNHDRSGVLITPNLSKNFWMTGGNEVHDNVIQGSGYADLTLSGPALEGNCFSGNDITTTMPVGLQAFASCDGSRVLPMQYELASLFSTIGLSAEVGLGLKPQHDYRDTPIPPAQESMPGGVDAPVHPAVGVFDALALDVDAIDVPALPDDLTVTQSKEPTVFGVPLTAGALSVFFGLYGYLLPFVLLAAWTALALWDIARREDLSKGASLGWIAVILLVPFLGPIAYHVASRSPLPGWLRGAMVGGGIAAYLVVLGIGVVAGGVL